MMISFAYFSQILSLLWGELWQALAKLSAWCACELCIHACLGWERFHLRPSHSLYDCHLEKISWQKSLVEKTWNIFKRPIITVLYFRPRNRYVTYGWMFRRWWWIFSKGADGLLCSCADDGKLRFFGADVVPQLEPMIMMDGMTLDTDDACSKNVHSRCIVGL